MADRPLPRRDPRDRGGEMSERLVRISVALGRFLRYDDRCVCGKDGWVSLDTALRVLYRMGLDTTEDDVLEVVHKSYTKNRPRFEKSDSKFQGGILIRAAERDYYRDRRPRNDRQRQRGDDRDRHSGVGGRGGGMGSGGYPSAGSGAGWQRDDVREDRAWPPAQAATEDFAHMRQQQEHARAAGPAGYGGSSSSSRRDIFSGPSGDDPWTGGADPWTSGRGGGGEKDATWRIWEGQLSWCAPELEIDPDLRGVDVTTKDDGRKIRIDNVWGTLHGDSEIRFDDGDIFERMPEEQAAGSSRSSAATDIGQEAAAPRDSDVGKPDPGASGHACAGDGAQDAARPEAAAPRDSNVGRPDTGASGYACAGDGAQAAACPDAEAHEPGYVAHRALAAFDATDWGAEYISFAKGELLFALPGFEQDGWAYGMNYDGTKKGWFPPLFAKREPPPPPC